MNTKAHYRVLELKIYLLNLWLCGHVQNSVVGSTGSNFPIAAKYNVQIPLISSKLVTNLRQNTGFYTLQPFQTTFKQPGTNVFPAVRLLAGLKSSRLSCAKNEIVRIFSVFALYKKIWSFREFKFRYIRGWHGVLSETGGGCRTLCPDLGPCPRGSQNGARMD